MLLVQQFVMILACLLMLAYIIYLVKREKLQLRYSLLWLCMSFFILVCSLFPDPLFSVTKFFGFESASNFIFTAASIFVLIILLSMSSIISMQQVAIKNLSQVVSLLEHDLKSTDAESREAIKHDECRTGK